MRQSVDLGCYNIGMNTKTIIVVLVVAALIVLAIVLWPKFSSAPENDLEGGATAANSPSASLGGQVYGAVSPDTAQAVPETNPFKAEANPYKDAYQNPFAQ